jgi:tRNA pseudouridine55 synthase
VLDVLCSKGTYVRVLAEDIGRELGCGAHLAGLRRTATGGFGIDETVTLEQLESMPSAARDAALRPPATLLRALPSLHLSAVDAARFRQGGAVPAPALEEGACAVFEEDALLGVADIAQGVAHPRRVVAPPPVASDGHG